MLKCLLQKSLPHVHCFVASDEHIQHLRFIDKDLLHSGIVKLYIPNVGNNLLSNNKNNNPVMPRKNSFSHIISSIMFISSVCIHICTSDKMCIISIFYSC